MGNKALSGEVNGLLWIPETSLGTQPKHLHRGQGILGALVN
jgi:hypothetical protein